MRNKNDIGEQLSVLVTDGLRVRNTRRSCFRANRQFMWAGMLCSSQKPVRTLEIAQLCSIAHALGMELATMCCHDVARRFAMERLACSGRTAGNWTLPGVLRMLLPSVVF